MWTRDASITATSQARRLCDRRRPRDRARDRQAAGLRRSVVALVERDGKPLSVGRRTRSVPASIRRALLARDGRCQFPGCERRRFVDAHHIVHWARGGETTSTTWSCSVAIITGSCTRAATRSRSSRRAGGAFAIPPATRSPPLPRHRPIRRRSRPLRAACSPAPARRWTWATAWMRCCALRLRRLAQLVAGVKKLR